MPFDNAVTHLTPHKQERELAAQLSALLSRHEPEQVELKILGEEKVFSLPKSVVGMLEHILAEMAAGKEVTLASVDAELTTQEAADLLNVSRPFVVKLLNNKKLPYRLIGSHRRLQLKDVLHYKRKMHQASEEAMQALVDQAEELNMGY
jgi:excisionase family DNA binding protein